MKFSHLTIFSLLALFMLAASPAQAQKKMSKKKVTALLNDLDKRQRALGDYKAVIYMEQKRKGESKLVYQAVTYRREDEEKFAFLFLKPKTEAGKGYLVLDKNLFLYDPTVGRWERRTERERFGGTDSRRSDFDVKNLAVDYDAEFVGEEKLGKMKVNHLKLTAKKDAVVPFPVMHLWLDKKTNNMLKQQDYSLSGKLLRTLYFPKWDKVKREGTGTHLYFPREIRIYDELEKGNQTIIVIQKVDLKDLPDNLFTKAWLQSKSR